MTRPEGNRMDIISTELRPLLEQAVPRFSAISDREIRKRWALYLFPEAKWMPIESSKSALDACTKMCYDIHHKDSHYREMYELLSISKLAFHAGTIKNIAERVYRSQDDLPRAIVTTKMECVCFIIEPHKGRRISIVTEHESTDRIAILSSGRYVAIPPGVNVEDLLQQYEYIEYDYDLENDLEK